MCPRASISSFEGIVSVVLVSNCTGGKLVRASGAAARFVMSVEGHQETRRPRKPHGRFTSQETAMFRQGDVLIIPIANLPAKLQKVPRENGRAVLAHGEVTGHAHAIKRSRAASIETGRMLWPI